MKAEHIDQFTDTVVDLDAEMWAWAELLGEARTSSNDGSRHNRSDRGRFNSQVDLLGSLGELYLLRLVAAADDSDDAVDYMRSHLYQPSGGRGVKGPDLRYRGALGEGLHELDVKSFDCSPNKKFFAINGNKHAALAGQCSAYFCVVAPPYGRRMAISRLVPYADVEGWELKSLRWGGSSSRNLALPQFLQRYFTSEISPDALRGTAMPRSEVETAKRDPIVRNALQLLIPSLALV